MSFDEHILDIHNIEKCSMPVDPATLQLVQKYFTNKQWVSKKHLKERMNDIYAELEEKIKQRDQLKNQLEESGIDPDDNANTEGESDRVSQEGVSKGDPLLLIPNND